MSKTEKKEVIAQNNAVAPSYMKQGSARGSEHVTAEDLTIPRLELVQALSPCRKRTDAAYIEGAEESFLFNSLTRELYGPEVKIVPVAFRKDYLLWRDRKAGGGFRGSFPSAEAAEKARVLLEDGDKVEAVETAQHFCLILKQDGSVEEIVVSMAKTKLKCSRKWNSLIRIAETDSFAKAYKLSGVTATNANNEEYYNFDVAVLPGFVDEATYHRAEKLYKAIESGTVKASTEGMDEGEAAPKGNGGEY